MAKTSGKKIHKLCIKERSEKVKKIKNDRTTDKITNNRTKKREIRKTFKKSEYETYKNKERIRSKRNREIDAMNRKYDDVLLNQFRVKEKLRKREQRAKKKTKNNVISSRKKMAETKRRKLIDERQKKILKLNLKVKMFENINRKLKRKLKSSTSKSSMIEEESADTTENSDTSTTLLGCVSPRSKKRAVRRLKLSTISPAKRDLNLDRLKVKPLGRPSITKEKVEAFLENDENSVIVPDVKKSKKGLRYRLMSIKDLYLKFHTTIYTFRSKLVWKIG